MSRPLRPIALLTDHRGCVTDAPADDLILGHILEEDRLLLATLEARGIVAERVDWSHPGEDWSRFECAVFRTTWDYYDRYPEFQAWLETVHSQVRLCNGAETIRWNMDKHYLADLERCGIPVVESQFAEVGASVQLASLLEGCGAPEAVLKPCVSGTARDTHRITRGNVAALEPVFQELISRKAMLLQPFQSEIVSTGEDSLMLFGGRFSHAVRKQVRAGDFRVQANFGGTYHEISPSREQLELAGRVVAALHPTPTYARVDMVRDRRGRMALMELEVIEPELWMRLHPPAAEAFAEAIVDFAAGTSR